MNIVTPEMKPMSSTPISAKVTARPAMNLKYDEQITPMIHQSRSDVQ